MPASLVILDNTAVMHGRSQVRPGGGEDRRHIQRLRVRAA
jgi:alpha-ketoglutarate-dependent taurine dioxygenase